MKSSLIFTFSRSYNFGASLQAFALMKTLRNLGSDAKIIDTRSEDEIRGKIEYRSDLRGRILNVFTYLNRKKLLEGKRKFNQFYYSKEDRICIPAINGAPKIDELEALGQLADVYISGSDQVFSPSLLNPLYFLDFNTWNAKCVSYAASLGVSEIPNDKKKRMADWLKKFDEISVREESAAVAIKEITDKQVRVNVDPTLLLEKEDWIEEEFPYEDLVGKEFVLAYFLYRPKNMNETLKMLHKKTGLPIVVVDTSAFRNIYHQKLILDAGPREFLWLIHNAKSVVTSSFHGTVMSIMYGTPFVVFNNPATPARIERLLSLTGLQSHWIKEDTELTRDSFLLTDDAKKQAKASILIEKEKSLQYLNECLED